MSDPWTYSGKVAALGQAGGVVTLVDESTFAISGHAGDMVRRRPRACSSGTPGSCPGWSCGSTGRARSRWPRSPTIRSRATFVSGCSPAAGRADSTLMVFRSRYVGQGMREDLVIRNFGDEPTVCSVELFIDSDFADSSR